MAVPTYTKAGAKATATAKLDKNVFGVDVKSHDLLKQAYTMYLANGRSNNARVKTRGEVRGGGRKPWRQKGTGRARFGSIRVPIWRGGGITFGPTGEETYTKRMSAKMKQKATKQALSLAAKDNRVSVIEAFEVKDGKTASASKLLKKLGVTGSATIVVSEKSDETTRAINNIKNVGIVNARYLNVYDILNADHLVFTKEALAIVSEWLGGDK